MSRWYTLHIKNEILFWFLLLALLPLLILSIVNYKYQKNELETEAKKHVKLLLNQNIKSVNARLERVSKEIKILSSIPTVIKGLEFYSTQFKKNGGKFNSNVEFYESFFGKIMSENRFYDIFLINKEGDIVYSVAKEVDLTTNLKTGVYSKSNLAKVYNNSISMLDLEISNFEFYPPSNKEAAFMAIPVYGENGILGALAVQIDGKVVKEVFNSKEGLGNTGEFFAGRFDKYGQIIASTTLKIDKDAVKHNYKFKNDLSTPIIKAVNGQSGVGILKDYIGNNVVAAWGYIPSLRWGVVSKVDLQEILIPNTNLKFYSLMILFFVSLGIVIAILTAIKHIVDPIEKLTRGVQNFAKGKMQSDVNINVDNEIGALSRNFNDMARSLKTSQETVQKYANELEEKVQIRTQELELAKKNIEKTNEDMMEFIDIVDKNVITSTTDLSGRIVKASSAFCKITGYTKEELIGKKHNIIRHPDVKEELYKDIWDTISSGKVWSGEMKNQRKDGSFYWVESTISPIIDANGKIKEYTSIRQDITDKKKVEELSITDQLTQLYNRLKLEEVFIDEINLAKRYETPFSMILLDIDHFKSVNDTYGHDVGDDTLKDVASILKHSVRNTDIVGRWGGEEFIVIAKETTLENTMKLAEKIRKNIETHTFKVIGKKTSSFGVSSYKEGDSQETLVKRADDALYKAKGGGRNIVVTIEL